MLENSPSAVFDADAVAVRDPDGWLSVFGLPRPDLAKRPYMLRPLAEIAADTVHPTTGKSLGDMWERFDSAGHQMVPVELEGED